MNAVSRNAARVSPATVSHGSKAVGAQRGDDQRCHADCLSSGEDRRAIRREVVGRQMAMRVDQHGVGQRWAGRPIAQDRAKRYPVRQGEKSGSGVRPLIRSARTAAEPQAIVQPSVPCPVLR